MIPGIYKSKVVEAVLAQTEKGQEYIGVTFEVVDGEFAGSAITTQLWWTPKAEEYSRGNLKRLGWNGEVRNVDGQVHLVIPSSVVPIGVKEEEYNNKTSLKVAWMVSPPSGVRDSDKLSGKQAANLLSRIKGQQSSNGHGGGSRTSSGRSAREEYGPGADEPDPFG